MEQWSFSYLHKWNFLFPLGREMQTLVVSVAVAFSLVFMAGIGLALDLQRRRLEPDRHARKERFLECLKGLGER